MKDRQKRNRMRVDPKQAGSSVLPNTSLFCTSFPTVEQPSRIITSSDTRSFVSSKNCFHTAFWLLMRDLEYVCSDLCFSPFFVIPNHSHWGGMICCVLHRMEVGVGCTHWMAPFYTPVLATWEADSFPSFMGRMERVMTVLSTPLITKRGVPILNVLPILLQKTVMFIYLSFDSRRVPLQIDAPSTLDSLRAILEASNGVPLYN